MPIDQIPPFDGKPCPACPEEVRDLAACAHNAVGAIEAARDGHGGWERAWRKLGELKRSLERFQPIMDAHFDNKEHAFGPGGILGNKPA